MSQHVSVCIVGFRNVEDVRQCIRALEQSTYSNFEIVVCENGGREHYEELKDMLSRPLVGGQEVHVIWAGDNLGYAAGVNRCMMASASADIWWLLNPDTVPQPEAMSRMVARLAIGDCDATGSTIYFPTGKVQSHGGRWRSWLGRAEAIGYGSALVEHPDPKMIEARQGYLSGASMMVSKRFVERVGLMREDYFLYCEEVEWCIRARKLGMRLGFAEGAYILHNAGATTGSALGVRSRPKTPVYLDERNKVLTVRDTEPTKMVVAVAAALFFIFARFGARGAWRQFGYAVDGWLAGVAGRRGRPTWIEPGSA